MIRGLGNMEIIKDVSIKILYIILGISFFVGIVWFCENLETVDAEEGISLEEVEAGVQIEWEKEIERYLKLQRELENKENEIAEVADDFEIMDENIEDEYTVEAVQAYSYNSVELNNSFDLIQMGTIEEDEKEDTFKVRILKPVYACASEVSSLYCSTKSMSWNEYDVYSKQVGKAFNNLNLGYVGCFSSDIEKEPIFIVTNMADGSISLEWHGFRYIEDKAIGSAGQIVTLYTDYLEKDGLNRVHVTHITTLSNSENLNDIDVDYLADFFSDVLGKQIDSLILSSILEYGQNNFAISKNEDRQIWSIDVEIGEEDNVGVEIELEIYLDEAGRTNVEISGETLYNL